TFTAGAAKQTRGLLPAVSGQRRNTASGRRRPEAPRRRDRFLQRPPHLEPETPASSACPLCSSRRRSGSGPLQVDRLAAEVLPAGRCSQGSVSGQVRGWPEKTAYRAQAWFPRNKIGRAHV